ncbi:hypothetical protein MGWOODY_XGa1913 [hydrothermal vent metagenome]|uniref:Uncharacterized protein n=1 Tax=hydrothermal vent metagenome TaxID=652676 RepID=A0A160TVJ1_9ZZZZ
MALDGRAKVLEKCGRNRDRNPEYCHSYRLGAGCLVTLDRIPSFMIVG